ncbi:cytochrome c [uncultured Mucilaginibacter sp.]|uniref:c-type cytochrome n=1 Tax=uncultured Mucilaginibacter sp. TaxID=797541 RepID=UPI0025F6D637|nr:cytochrome c [uncultured Mucilaginibacter sp.]
MKIKYTLLIFLLVGCFSAVKAQSKKPANKAKPIVAAGLKSSEQRGQAVYAANCLSCHQVDGGGIPGMNAPLIKTSYVLGSSDKLVNILLKGMQGVEIDGEEYKNIMPAFAHLTNQQIADVLTYVRNNFGNKAPAVTVKEVAAIRE